MSATEDKRRTVECVVIGEIRTPYKRLSDCPRTVHENPAICTLLLDPAYVDGLLGLERESHVLVLYWLDQARRDRLRRPERPDREDLGKRRWATGNPSRFAVDHPVASMGPACAS